MPVNWLATLEATILKMPVRDKTPVGESKPVFLKNKNTGEIINNILSKYPQHKRVLFLQTKYLNNQNISDAEIKELERFKKLLLQ